MSVSLRSFGAAGDGVTDDTAAIQSCLDVYSGRVRSGAIDVPAGYYRTTRPLVYRGSMGYSLRLRGEVVGSSPSGSVFVYDGPPGGAVFDFSGGSDCVIEDLAFFGG